MSRRLVVFALLLACPAASLGFTYHVPGDHSSIQAAIGLASPSAIDTVLVGPGMYAERLRIIGKAIVLRGAMGAEATTIHGMSEGNVITMNAVGRSCIVEDLTVTGGASNHPDSVGAGIYLNQYASPTIQRCRLVGNQARTGGGINAYFYCEPLIRDCLVADNSGGSLFFELGPQDMGTTYAEVENTVIADNFGYAVWVLKGARVSLRNCTIAQNFGDGVRIEQQARVKVYNCVITHNVGAGLIRIDGSGCFQGLGCNDVFGNTRGSYVGANPGDPCFSGRGTGDVSVEPCFQNAAAGNFHLQRNSPLCALRGGSSCGVLGAFADACSSTPGSCVVTIAPASWGAVKTLFR